MGMAALVSAKTAQAGAERWQPLQGCPPAGPPRRARAVTEAGRGTGRNADLTALPAPPVGNTGQAVSLARGIATFGPVSARTAICEKRKHERNECTGIVACFAAGEGFGRDSGGHSSLARSMSGWPRSRESRFAAARICVGALLLLFAVTAPLAAAAQETVTLVSNGNSRHLYANLVSAHNGGRHSAPNPRVALRFVTGPNPNGYLMEEFHRMTGCPASLSYSLQDHCIVPARPEKVIGSPPESLSS